MFEGREKMRLKILREGWRTGGWRRKRRRRKRRRRQRR